MVGRCVLLVLRCSSVRKGVGSNFPAGGRLFTITSLPSNAILGSQYSLTSVIYYQFMTTMSASNFFELLLSSP